MISDLQLALLGVGAVVVGGVVVYNTVVERRAKARAERAFGKEHPDVLFEVPGRREPTMGKMPEAPGNEPARGRIEPAASADGEDEPPIAEAPSGSESVVSTRIDTVAVILADDPINRESLDPLLDALQVHTVPVNVEGIVEEQWQPIESSTRLSWRELRAGLQLASRSGPVSEEEVATFNDTIASFAEAVNAVSQRESPTAAAARARELDRFCADADIEVDVNFVGKYGATFAMARVKALAMEHGLSETAAGELVSYARDGTPEFAVRRQDREGARADISYATGLTFALDVPHVADPGAAFDAMVALAEACAAALGGELVDDNKKALTAPGLAAIRRSLEQVFRDMEAHGIPAGSALARRLFS